MRQIVDALVFIARDFIPNVPVQEGSRPRKGQQARPSDHALGHRDVARPWLRQVTAANRHTPRCFQPVIGAHLPDGILWLLVENARQLKESSGVADDGSIIRGHQIPN